jgi:hypothetical protein
MCVDGFLLPGDARRRVLSFEVGGSTIVTRYEALDSVRVYFRQNTVTASLLDSLYYCVRLLKHLVLQKQVGDSLHAEFGQHMVA